MSFGELSRCLIQQNYIFFLSLQTKTVHTYFRIVISQSVTIKQSHQSWGSAQKQVLELFPVKPHLSETKSIPEGDITQCRISKIIIIIHQYAWLNHSLRLIFPFCFIDRDQTKMARKRQHSNYCFPDICYYAASLKTTLVHMFEQRHTDQMSIKFNLWFTSNHKDHLLLNSSRTGSFFSVLSDWWLVLTNLGIWEAHIWAPLVCFYSDLTNQCDGSVKWRFHWTLKNNET